MTNEKIKITTILLSIFPKLKDIQKLYDKIRKDFVRVSRKLELYLKTGTSIPLYSFRHSFITQRDRKNANDVVSVIQIRVMMIRKYYRSKRNIRCL